MSISLCIKFSLEIKDILSLYKFKRKFICTYNSHYKISDEEELF